MKSLTKIVHRIKKDGLIPDKKRVVISVQLSDCNAVDRGFEQAVGKEWCSICSIEVDRSWISGLSRLDIENFIHSLSEFFLKAHTLKKSWRNLWRSVDIDSNAKTFFESLAPRSRAYSFTLHFKQINVDDRHNIENMLDFELKALRVGHCEGGSSTLDDSTSEIHVTCNRVKGTDQLLSILLAKIGATAVRIERE